MMKSGLFTMLAALALVFAAACTSTRVNTIESDLAKQRIEESVLVLPPVSGDTELRKTCVALGEYLVIEVPKRINGPTVFAGDIPSLRPSLHWENIFRDGAFDIGEIAAIGKAANCNSVLATQVINTNPYPPFRMVLRHVWVDTNRGHLIANLYQDLDLSDSETNYRFSNFSGHGPAKIVYEQIFYSEALYQTASLSPDRFIHFAAASSARIVFGDRHEVPWWYLWRIF